MTKVEDTPKETRLNAAYERFLSSMGEPERIQFCCRFECEGTEMVITQTAFAWGGSYIRALLHALEGTKFTFVMMSKDELRVI
jgi:hypothetical protein